jgi:hypothetical protein
MDLILSLRGKLFLLPSGSRLVVTSKAEDAELAPKESVIYTLCR